MDTDYETYDCLEAGIESKPTGILTILLPNPLYRAIFGSLPPDPEVVTKHREETHQEYTQLLDEHSTLQEELTQLSTQSNTQTTTANKQDAQRQSPPPQDEPTSDGLDLTEDSLDDQVDVIESKIEQCKDIRRHANSLNSEAAVFLRKSEQESLTEISSGLQVTIDELKEKRATIRETINLRQGLAEWQEQLTAIEGKIGPYLDFTDHEVDPALRGSLDRLARELQNATESADQSLLSTKKSEEFNELRTQVARYSSHLENYEAKFVDHLFNETISEIKDKLVEIQTRLEPVRAGDRQLESEADIKRELGELQNQIDELRNYSLSGGYSLNNYISTKQQEKLQSISEQINEEKTYVNSKSRFDSQIDTVESKVADLREDMLPYFSYEKYLTRPVRSTFELRLRSVTNAIETLENDVNFDVLSSQERTRYSRIANLSAVEDCLTDYNEKFVDTERRRYQNLFANLGPQDLDLTRQQQYAVIRNDIYNQVIAAAGTGKTLVLTTRIAYLLESQQVDPDRILVVTFTKEARDEMQERLSQYFDITNVRVETVHAFGYDVIRAASEKHVDIIDPHQITNIVDRKIREARNGKDPEFLSHYYDFLVHFEDIYFEETDFETKEKYIEARMEQRYTTLQGEEVKSRAEKQIADFLFTHKVDYRYEDLATWADTADDKGAYEPDFYLPEHDIYIEHWGIDVAGEIAPWFSWSTEQYHEKIRWARNQFATREKTLIETYDFEHTAGNLESVLHHRLGHHGVDLNKMEFGELINSAFDYNQREGWIKSQFKDFIQNAKRFDVKPGAIESALIAERPRQFHFGQCGIILLQEYQKFLMENDAIDFADMVNRSLEIARSDPAVFRSQYDHILVDEFQDIGKGEHKLLRELTGEDAARLFAVGDDWQSIYSFQGAVVDYFREFSDRFGPPARTDLTDNFRSPPQIIEAGNELIANNDDQIEKDVSATVTHETTPLVHELQGYTDYDYIHRVGRYAADLVGEYLNKGASPGDIMVLCRFDDAVLYLDEVKNQLRTDGVPYRGKSDEYRGQNGNTEDGVSVYTVHQSKGREAEHVILVHAAEGPFGFPPEGREDALLQPVKPITVDKIAEERRTFYVAVTRTQQTLDILTRHGRVSRFVDEIASFTKTVDRSDSIEPLDDVGAEMSISAKVDSLFEETHPKKHQDGILADQFGGSARFISWKNNDPPTLELGKWYRFDGVEVGKFNEQKELKVTSQCSITEIPEPDTEMEYSN